MEYFDEMPSACAATPPASAAPVSQAPGVCQPPHGPVRALCLATRPDAKVPRAGAEPDAGAERELELIRKALAGFAPAQTALLKRLGPVVTQRARAFVAGRPNQRLGANDAHDLAQCVWAELWKNGGKVLSSYDPSRGMTLESYVGMVTQRELWRMAVYARRQRRSKGIELALDGKGGQVADERASPELLTCAHELLIQLSDFVCRQLSCRAERAYELLYIDGTPPSETARILGIDLQTVYNWQHDVRRHARDFLRNYQRY